MHHTCAHLLLLLRRDASTFRQSPAGCSSVYESRKTRCACRMAPKPCNDVSQALCIRAEMTTTLSIGRISNGSQGCQTVDLLHRNSEALPLELRVQQRLMVCCRDFSCSLLLFPAARQTPLEDRLYCIGPLVIGRLCLGDQSTKP